LTEHVDRLEAQYAELVETKAKLDARVTALIEHEPEVSGLIEAARARQLEQAANARLDDLAAAPDVHDADVQSTVNSIRSRLAAAEAQIEQLEQHGLAQGETPEVLKRKELEDQLEARKARLGMVAPPPPPPPEASPQNPQ
jgi:tripartite-type tricarboxylate transporter receptor subunit TctC